MQLKKISSELMYIEKSETHTLEVNGKLSVNVHRLNLHLKGVIDEQVIADIEFRYILHPVVSPP